MFRCACSSWPDNYADAVRSLLACGEEAESSAPSENDTQVVCARTGRTPLHSAAQQGHRTVLSELLDGRADASARDLSGQVALHCAAQRGHGLLVDLLLEAGAEHNVVDDRGRTAIHAAAQQGHAASVRNLLLGRAAAAATDTGGRTALYLAAQYGHFAAGRLLTDGRSVALADSQGRTPLHAASLGSAGSDGVDGGVALVRQLLAQRGDVRAKDRRGRTPLHDAARAGAYGAALLLLEAGADPSAPDDDGASPRQDAASFKRLRLVPVLDAASAGGAGASREEPPRRSATGASRGRDRPASAETHERRSWTVPRFMRALYPQGIFGQSSRPTRQVVVFWHRVGRSLLSWADAPLAELRRLAGDFFAQTSPPAASPAETRGPKTDRLASASCPANANR